LPPLPEISYAEYNEDYDRDDSSDWGGAKAKAAISVVQTEFASKQSAKSMGQPNCGAFNKWKNVWVPRSLEMKHRSIIQ
jgi:hypothetical protein